jgi:hypothetical protein
MTETWEKIGVAGEYTLWMATDTFWKRYFNVTKNGLPPKNGGGYLDPEYLLETLKGQTIPADLKAKLMKYRR